MPDKKVQWKNNNTSLVELWVDESTQKQMLKDARTTEVVKKVFNAVWNLQDKIDKTLKK